MFLLGYSTMKRYANIDIKLSILKEPPPEAAKKWGEALELFKAGDFGNAAEAFGTILINGKYPREVANNRAICYWRMAEAAFAQKNYDAARSHVRRMVETCPVLPELDKTLSTFFAATAIAGLAGREPDLRSALRDLRASVRLELRRDSLAALVTALWRARELKAAGEWANRCAAFDIKNPFLLALSSFMEKVCAGDFPAAEKALEKLRGIPLEGNEAALVDMFRHELEWEKYIAEQRGKGKKYEDIISEVKKYRTSSDAYRKDADRLRGALPESK
jgi:tetratricopeptide (TPR) repeat protein